MKSFAALVAYFLLLIQLSLPAMAIEVRGNAMILSAEEMRACQDGGGCKVVTMAALLAALDNAQENAFEAGFAAGAKKGYAVGFEAGRKAQKDSI